jgi:ribose 5-phosphate isomerase
LHRLEACCEHPASLLLLSCHVQELKAVVGLVDHGLFVGMASKAYVGKSDGSVDVFTV